MVAAAVLWVSFFFFFFLSLSLSLSSRFIVLGLLCFWDFLNFFLGIFGNGLYMRDLDLKFFLAYKSSLRLCLFWVKITSGNAFSYLQVFSCAWKMHFPEMVFS